jgi:Sec-independent protein secretion pathway component TatC
MVLAFIPCFGSFKHSSPFLSILFLFVTSLMIWSNRTRLHADTNEDLVVVSLKSNLILGLITASPVPVESNKCSWFLFSGIKSFQK